MRAGELVLTEAEPLFDAADIAPAGKDLFVQLSLVTNRGGYRPLPQDAAGISSRRFRSAARGCPRTFSPFAPAVPRIANDNLRSNRLLVPVRYPGAAGRATKLRMIEY